jgi:hypothetical protein
VDTLSRAYDYIRMLDGEGYPPAFIETEKLRIEFSDAQYMGSWVSAKVVIKKRE